LRVNSPIYIINRLKCHTIPTRTDLMNFHVFPSISMDFLIVQQHIFTAVSIMRCKTNTTLLYIFCQ
jgi:hypothetical protein